MIEKTKRKLTKIVKRNGSIVDFTPEKITNAIMKAMYDVNETNLKIAEQIAENIANTDAEQLTIEEIERKVVKGLYLANLDEVADSYSDYKAKRALIRKQNETKFEGKFLSSDFVMKYKHKPSPFTTEVGKFVYYRTYSRYLPKENRRENWWETVYRVIEFNFGLQLNAMHRNNIPITETVIQELREEAKKAYDLMFNLKLFPSGRTLFVGGTPVSYKNGISNFNCSFVVVDSFQKFSEIFLVLMLGKPLPRVAVMQ